MPEELPEEAVASLKQLTRWDRHRCSATSAAKDSGAAKTKTERSDAKTKR